VVIRAVARIQQEPWFGGCLVVGDGPERSSLMRLSRNLHIRKDSLEFSPPVPIDKVREMMRSHDILILSSNRQEGWGAVAAEAMSEGCVLVANEQAGAARALVHHGETGLLFADGDADRLVDCLAQLAHKHDMRERIRQTAWRKVHESWSAGVGADRVVRLSQDLLDQGDSGRYLSGLCSRCDLTQESEMAHDRSS